MKEADIIKKFRTNLPGHWTSIENSVTSGVPDYVASSNGNMCWIEFKRLYGRDIILRPLQRTWMIRETRHNDSVFVAWWDTGPVAIYATDLLDINPTEKGGKLHYPVATSRLLIQGWDELKQILFEN